MLEMLKPKLHVQSIWVLNLEQLKDRSIEGVIIDIDNTLVEWDQKHANEKVKSWLRSLRMQGFKVCLVSNNTKNRVATFNETLNIPAICMASKPRLKPFQKAMKIMNTTKNTTAVIGDQLFTDILGGNRLKLFTILVAPLGDKEFLWTKIIRQIEKFILKSISNSI